MKRERVYCLLLAIIGAILVLFLTIKFIPPYATIPIFYGYFSSTSVISISVLGIIKDKKSKYNLYGLLVGTDSLILITNFIIGCFGVLNETMRFIVTIIFVITFLLFMILCNFWSKYEKENN